MEKHLYKISFGFLWLSAILCYFGLYIFSTASFISCASIAVYKAAKDHNI